MLRYLAITLCSGHVEQVYWWRLSAHGYGLVDDRDNFRLRPAFYALKFFLDLLKDATFNHKWPTASDIYLLEFSTPTNKIIMAWTTQKNNINLPLNICKYSEAFDRAGALIVDPQLSQSPIFLIC